MNNNNDAESKNAENAVEPTSNAVESNAVNSNQEVASKAEVPSTNEVADAVKNDVEPENAVKEEKVEEKPTIANIPPTTSDEKVYAALCYLPFVAILSIILKPDSAYVRLHAKQGLTLSILFFLSGILAALVSLFGLIGQLLGLLFGLVPLLITVLLVYSIYNVTQGLWWKIPVISVVADMIPIEVLAITSKEKITGQVGVAKEDYDNRSDTMKKEVTENVAPVKTEVVVDQNVNNSNNTEEKSNNSTSDQAKVNEGEGVESSEQK